MRCFRALFRRALRAALLLITAASALASAGCGNDTTAPPGATNIRITSGLENGWGGSGHEIRVTPVLAERDTWDHYGAPRTTETIQVTPAAWRALRDAVDRAALEALPDVVGCPGCTDAPAEWLEVRYGAFHKRVRFSPWDDLGAGNAELLLQVRALRMDGTP